MLITRVLLILCMALGSVPPAWAGENPSAKLAMHVVASSEYLSCWDLFPVGCDSINVDLSAAEVLAAGGYGYVAFVAYDIVGITGAEFAVDGWPTGRGAPRLSSPFWCPEGTLTMGNHLGSGGISSFPCVGASLDGIVLIGYCSFGPLDEEDLPITLEYVASSFSYPNDPQNFLLDCTVQYEEDAVTAGTGCAIGGTYEGQPDCPGARGGGTDDGGVAGEEGGSEPDGGFEWPVVIETGVLYAYGNRLDPPYVFTLEDDGLHVNGVRLSPALRRRPAPEVTITDRQRAQYALITEAMDMADSLLRGGIPIGTIVARVSDLYRQSSIVDSVSLGGESSIWVYWNNNPYAVRVSIPTEIPGPPPVRDRCRISIGLAKELGHSLGRSATVFFGNGYRVSVPEWALEALNEEMQLLHETRDPDAEGLRLIPRCVGEDLLNPLTQKPDR